MTAFRRDCILTRLVYMWHVTTYLNVPICNTSRFVNARNQVSYRSTLAFRNLALQLCQHAFKRGAMKSQRGIKALCVAMVLVEWQNKKQGRDLGRRGKDGKAHSAFPFAESGSHVTFGMQMPDAPSTFTLSLSFSLSRCLSLWSAVSLRHKHNPEMV